MKYIPMLFSTPMVQQLLAGNKTMTRRVIKPQPNFDSAWKNLSKYGNEISKAFTGNNKAANKIPEIQVKGNLLGVVADDGFGTGICTPNIVVPYHDGDVIWVRETFVAYKVPVKHPKVSEIEYEYKADESPIKFRWKPGIHMPKEACRLFLKITDVRVERLNEISESDSIAEGIPPDPECGFKSFETISEGKHRGKSHPNSALPNRSAKTSFTELWKTINGKDSWDANPWVWVVEFERIEKPNDFI